MDDEEKMTADEKKAERQRAADLKKEIKHKDDTELKLFAQHIGIDPAEHPERKDLEAAVELKAETDAAAGRKAIRDLEAEQERSVASEDANRPKEARIIRALNAEFCRDIPQEGRAGSFEPDEDHPRFGGDYDVPDGKYRVAGSEWTFLIHNKKLQGAERATEANKYGGKHVIPIE